MNYMSNGDGIVIYSIARLIKKTLYVSKRHYLLTYKLLTYMLLTYKK